MGRFADLCGAVAESAEEGADGLILLPETWNSLRGEWSDEDIEDALGIVHETLLQGELVERAESLCARLVEALASFGDEAAFREAERAGVTIPLDTVAHIARRMTRLEEVLAAYREGSLPDQKAFDAFYTRLMNLGIEEDMEPQFFDRAAPDEDDEDV